MLTEWTIGNFKSISERTALKLAPLTIICGANSSGKSTIIQSILLIAQTLGSPATHRPLIFNGELVKLGYLADIFHHGEDEKLLEIGFELKWTPRFSPVDHRRGDHKGENKSISAFTTFQKPAQSKPTISKMDLTKLNFRVDEYQILINAENAESKLKNGLRQQTLQIPIDLQAEIENGRFDYRIEDSSSPELADTRSSRLRPYGSLTHFLPRSRLVQYNVTEDFVRATIKECAELLSSRQFSSDTTVLQISFKDVRGRHLREILDKAIDQAKRRKDIRSEQSIQELSNASSMLQRSRNLDEWIEMMRKGVTTRVRTALSQELAFYAERTEFDPSPMGKDVGLRARPFHPDIINATDEIIDFFVRRLKYLGPLRDDPKMIFSLPPVPDYKDVGLKGEYTAAVLERFGKDVSVQCPVPPAVGQIGLKSETMPLLDAVILWLRHMELVENVVTEDRGKMGVELSVHTQGLERQLDLTNVGVGVSQVLPILTMCLLAPEKGLVILEQPELHLHPKVQGILGDFLLGIASRGTQCIIETHSERIINRMRRRIAEAPEDSIMRLVQIYFTERRHVATQVIQVEPNEYGAIQKWPKGFSMKDLPKQVLLLRPQLANAKQNLSR